jgi:hypothetical protein
MGTCQRARGYAHEAMKSGTPLAILAKSLKKL